MIICDICGKSLENEEIQTLTEEQVVRATSAGFVPSKLPMQGLAEMFGMSLSKADHWRGTVSKYKGTGAKWGVCLHCHKEILNYLDSRRGGMRTASMHRKQEQKQTTPANLTVCPICGVKLKPENLKRHKSKCEMRQRTEAKWREEKQREEEKQQKEEEKRRQAQKIETERCSRVQATRKSSGQCIMCGQRLSFVQKMFGKDRHRRCTSFKE